MLALTRSALVLVALLLGCTSPVVYPRLAEVAPPGALRLAAGFNYGFAPGSVRERVPAGEPGEPRPVAREFQGTAASSVTPVTTPLGLLFTYVWAEPAAAIGLFRPCELSGLVSLLRAGLELRCAVLDEKMGAPLALALAAGGLHRTAFIASDGFAFRGGLELSSRGRDVSPLLNAYLRYGPTMRIMADDDLSFGGGGESGTFFTREGAQAERDELVLSVPVGLAIARGKHLIFAVVPEFTLSARDRTPVRCIGCAEELHDFEQHWALYFTMVYTATIGGDD